MYIFFVHWNQAEAEGRAAKLTEAGHSVHIHFSSDQDYKLGEKLPEAVVISLDRLPSHGRAVAEWVWEAKKRQQIPVVFVGGSPEKVKALQEKHPQARYCAWDELTEVLAGL